MAGPFKMKGSPMARNFGAPFKQENKDDEKIDINTKDGRDEAKSKIEIEANKPGLNMAKLIRKQMNGIALTKEEKAFAAAHAAKKGK